MAIHKNSLALTALSQLADRSRTIATKSMRGNNIAKWLPKQCIICCFSASTVLRFGLIISTIKQIYLFFTSYLSLDTFLIHLVFFIPKFILLRTVYI